MVLGLVVLTAVLGEVPSGVTYVPASAEVNARARAVLDKMFAGTPPALASAPGDGLLLLGPFLGQRLERLDMSGFLKTDLVVPFGEFTAQMKSYGARNAAERKAMWALLRDLAPAGKVKVRGMNAAEMKVVWPFISWDLTEPLFIVEAGDRKWLIDFDEEGTSPHWVEDLTAPCFTAHELDGKCLCLEGRKVANEWRLAFVDSKPCLEGAPKKKNDNPLGLDPSVELPMVKFLIPDAEMGRRLTVEQLAGYVKRLMATVNQPARANQKGARPGALTVSVAVKPGGEHRVWVTAAKSHPVPAGLVKSVGEAMRTVEAPDPRGLVIFQLHVLLWGGGAKLDDEVFPNIPDEWAAIVSKESDRIDAESLVNKAWK